MAAGEAAAARVASILRDSVPAARQALVDSHTNLEGVAAYCESLAVKGDMKKPYEDTRQYAIDALSSVAYQVHTLAYNVLELLSAQTADLASLEAELTSTALLAQVRKEVTGVTQLENFTTKNNETRVPKISALDLGDADIRPYERKRVNYSLLDNVGHAASDGGAPGPSAPAGMGSSQLGGARPTSSIASPAPVRAPVAPVIAPVAPVVAPVAPIAPVIAPVAPVIAPVAPNMARTASTSNPGIPRTASQSAPPPPFGAPPPPFGAPPPPMGAPPPQFGAPPPPQFVAPPPPPMEAPPPPLAAPPPPPPEDECPPPPPPPPEEPAPAYLCRARALYDYTATKADELTFREGDVMYVSAKNDDGWWYGVLNGMVGLFPGNYCEEEPIEGASFA